MTLYCEKNIKNQKPLTLCHHHQDEKKPCLQGKNKNQLKKWQLFLHITEQSFLDHYNNLIKTVKGWNIFGNRMLI